MSNRTVMERKEIIKPSAEMSVRKQCKLLSVSRGSFYFKPKGESDKDLEIVRLMDEHHLQHPYKGVLQMQDLLRPG